MAEDTGGHTPPDETPVGEEQKLNAAIVDACPAVIYAKDTQGRYLLVNRQWEALFHVTRDHVKGKTDYDLFPKEEDVELFRDHDRRVVDGRRAMVWEERVTLGGELRILESMKFPILNASGMPDAVCGISTDITERKRSAAVERNRQAGEEYYRALVENAMDIVTVLDADGTIRSVSPALTRILGYAPEERIGKTIDAIVHPDDLPTLSKALAEARQGYRISATLQYRCRHKDGSLRMLESTARNLLQDPTVNGIVINTRDVTEHQRTEEALRQKEAALRDSQAQLRGLTSRLLNSQEEERSRIARELHDDLNQKLAFLAVEAERLEQQLSDWPDPIRDRLRSLQRKAVDLSEDVRRMAHQLHPAVLDDLGLEPALRSYCAEFSRLAGIPVKFSYQNPSEPLPTEVALCLYRITQELLRNVAKHSRAPRATVKLVRAADAVRLSITDAGIGFNPGQAKGKGSLGIASVEERIRLVHGSIRIQSAPEKGTRIRVRVPLPRRNDETPSSASGR